MSGAGEPPRRIHASWVRSAPVQAVLDALEAVGGEGCARFVGGCVRNAVIGRPIADIDVATTLTPDRVITALEAGGVRAVPTGVEHGTVTAVAKGRPIEVTTLRRDVETDGRRAVVAFTTDWREDALRRDFTLNTLYAGRAGEIFDPTEQGVADALAGRIVFVGDAEQRLREDHLRSLRFFRFLAWYGRGEPDRTALAAITALKDQVKTLAAERISSELLKLLAAEDPRPAVQLMQQTGVLGVILPEPLDLARFDALVPIQRRLGESDPVLRLAALLPDDPQAAADIAERLRLSNAHRDRIEAALTPAPAITVELSRKDARAALYRMGVQRFRDRVELQWAAAGGGEAPAWRALLAAALDWTTPTLPVTGADVLAAGAPKGPRVGELLRGLEAWWIEGDFTADREAALAELKARLA